MIKKHLEESIVFTKNELRSLLGKKIIVVKTKNFIFFCTEEEFKNYAKYLESQIFPPKKRRELMRCFFAKAKPKKIRKKRFTIKEL